MELGIGLLEWTQNLRQGLGGQLARSAGAGGQAGEADAFALVHGDVTYEELGGVGGSLRSFFYPSSRITAGHRTENEGRKKLAPYVIVEQDGILHYVSVERLQVYKSGRLPRKRAAVVGKEQRRPFGLGSATPRALHCEGFRAPAPLGSDAPAGTGAGSCGETYRPLQARWPASAAAR